jgi:hypothetical protein
MFMLVLASLLAVVAAADPAAPQHIIFFLIDDYGFADASYKATMCVTMGDDSSFPHRRHFF